MSPSLLRCPELTFASPSKRRHLVDNDRNGSRSAVPAPAPAPVQPIDTSCQSRNAIARTTIDGVSKPRLDASTIHRTHQSRRGEPRGTSAVGRRRSAVPRRLAGSSTLTVRPTWCEPRSKMPARARIPRTRAFAGLLMLLVCMWLTLGCRPRAQQGGLSEGPPQIDARTPVLALFDPASLAGPAATGLDLSATLAGPPQPPEPPPLPAPAIVDYGPTGEASEYPTIQIRFNRPMVAFGEKPRVSAEQAGFRIDPPIAGQAYWAEPTRLVFEPADALPLATEYRVSFTRKITAVDGPAIDVDLQWSF